jgi:hypothetical protein
MFLDQKPWIFVWRPFYQRVLTPYAFPFLGAIKTFFFRETWERLSESKKRADALEELVLNLLSQPELAQRISEVERLVRSNDARLNAIEENLRATEREGHHQWAALEQLLLNLLRQPNGNETDQQAKGKQA